MKNYFLLLFLVLGLVACKTNSSEISTIVVDETLSDEFSEDNYDGPVIDETMFSEDDFFEEPTSVRAIYNPSRTLLTDLVHTKL